MRVVQPVPGRRLRLPSDSDDAGRGAVAGRRHGRVARAARIERLGLFAVSVILLPGLWLAYVGQTAGVVDCASGAPPSATTQPGTGCPINLNALRNSRGLLPALTMFEPGERNAVAAALFERAAAGAGQPRLDNVGGLATVTLPAGVVRRDKRLVSLNARLLERPGAANVPVLSAAELAALKPNVIVRTLDQYQDRVATLVIVFMLAFWLAHTVRAWRGTTGDAVLLPVVQLLTGLGLMTLLAIRDPLRDMVIAEPMAMAIAAGCALWAIVSFIDFESPRLRRAVLPPFSVPPCCWRWRSSSSAAGRPEAAPRSICLACNRSKRFDCWWPLRWRRTLRAAGRFSESSRKGWGRARRYGGRCSCRAGRTSVRWRSTS